MTRRERERLRHRDEIIDAAEKVFFKKGYDSATIDEIGQIAEYSRRTLYTYFKGKDDLCLAVYLRYNRKKVDLIKEMMATRKTGYDKLYAFGEAYYKFFKQFPEYLRFQLYLDIINIDTEQIHEKNAEAYNLITKESYDVLMSAMEEGIKDKSLKFDIAPEVFITYLFNPLRSVAYVAIILCENHPVFECGKLTPDEYYMEFFRRLLASVKG